MLAAFIVSQGLNHRERPRKELADTLLHKLLFPLLKVDLRVRDISREFRFLPAGTGKDRHLLISRFFSSVAWKTTCPKLNPPLLSAADVLLLFSLSPDSLRRPPKKLVLRFRECFWCWLKPSSPMERLLAFDTSTVLLVSIFCWHVTGWGIILALLPHPPLELELNKELSEVWRVLLQYTFCAISIAR